MLDICGSLRTRESDRYNGKEFKRYKLMDGDKELNSLLNLNWLYIDPEGLWEIGKKGKIFRYDRIHDTFELVYKLPIEDFGGFTSSHYFQLDRS